MGSVEGQSNPVIILFILHRWVISDQVRASTIDTKTGKVVDSKLAAHE